MYTCIRQYFSYVEPSLNWEGKNRKKERKPQAYYMSSIIETYLSYNKQYAKL